MKLTLLDTNIVVYAHRAEDSVAASFIEHRAVACSVVTRIEALGFASMSGREAQLLVAFFSHVPTFALNDQIADIAISLRRIRRISLGDSIIAATALAHDLALATRSTSDFAWIEALELIDPYR